VVDNLISLANRTGVTFYTVDTRGVSAEDETISGLASMEMTGAESRQRGTVTSPVAGHNEMDDVAVPAVSNRQLSMQDLAESTGGFAVTNMNQIAQPMQRVMEDIRTHYELSYAPKSTVYDGHFRRIEVKLKRPKLTVRTRKGTMRCSC
jgi:VWFA-related protein